MACHSLEEGEEEADQLQVSQEGEGEAAGEADHLQGEEVVEGVVAVLPCCLAKGEEGEEEGVVVLRGLVGEGEEVAEAGVVEAALGPFRILDLVR